MIEKQFVPQLPDSFSSLEERYIREAERQFNLPPCPAGVHVPVPATCPFALLHWRNLYEFLAVAVYNDDMSEQGLAQLKEFRQP